MYNVMSSSNKFSCQKPYLLIIDVFWREMARLIKQCKSELIRQGSVIVKVEDFFLTFAYKITSRSL